MSTSWERPPPDRDPVPRFAGPVAAAFAAAFARRAAGCPVRSVALGVGPLPFRALRRWPPEPVQALQQFLALASA